MIDINLLPQQNVSTIEENKVKRYSLFAVVAFSVVWLSVLGGLFFYDQTLKSQNNSLTQQKSSLQSHLDDQKVLISNVITLKQKISGIKYIQKNRFDLPSSLTYIFHLFPSGIDITKISIDENRVVSMDLKGNDPEIVSSFISKMGDDNVLKNPTLSTFRLAEDSGYVFNISAQYGDKVSKITNN